MLRSVWFWCERMAHIISDAVIFNHIPKCGGSYVKEACKNAGAYVDVVGKGRNRSEKGHAIAWAPFTFTFVRSPITWYVSWYCYRKNKSKKVFPSSLWNPCLNKTIKDICETQPGFLTERYYRYITPSTGNTSFVGKWEYLIEHLVVLLKLAKVRFDEQALRSTPRVNVSKFPSHADGSRQRLSEETVEIIMRSEKDIFANFYPNSSFPDDSIIMIF